MDAEKALEAYYEELERAKRERQAKGEATPSLFYLEDDVRHRDLRRGPFDTER